MLALQVGDLFRLQSTNKFEFVNPHGGPWLSGSCKNKCCNLVGH